MATKSTVNRFDSGIDMDTSINKYRNSNYYDAQDMRIISKDILSIGALSNVIGNDATIDIDDGIQKVVANTTINDDLYLFTYGINSSNLNIYYLSTSDSTLTISFGELSYNYIVDTTPQTLPPGYLGQIYYDNTSSDIAAFYNAFKGASELTSEFVITYDGGSSSSIIFTPKDSNSNYKVTTSSHAYIGVSYTNTGSSIYKVTDYKTSDISTQSTLLYNDSSSTNKLNFDTADYVSVIGKFETGTISKLYWANGIDPLRFMNLAIDYTGKEVEIFDHIPNVEFGNISTEILDGGNLLSGVVQYAYQYYDKNGSSTTFSQASKIIKLSNISESSIGGSDIGENAKKSVGITLTDLDTNYNRIRLVSLFSEQFDSVPTVNIVVEIEYNSDNLFIIDSGNNIGSITLDEYRAFSQTTISPKYIETKDNILFAGNIKEDTFSSDAIDNWDARSYGFDGYGGEAVIYDSPISGTGDGDYYTIAGDGSWAYSIGGIGTDWSIPDNYSCVNRDNSIYDNECAKPVYAYNPILDASSAPYSGTTYPDRDGSIFGGYGKNVEYFFKKYQADITFGYDKNITYKEHAGSVYDTKLNACQQDEIYRVGIKFFNNKGQSSFTKWIGDIRWPSITYDTDTPLGLSIKINTFPNDSSIVGYQIVRVDRSVDTSIKATGILSPTIHNGGRRWPSLDTVDINDTYNNNTVEGMTIDSSVLEFLSPEVMYNGALSQYSGNKIITFGTSLRSRYYEQNETITFGLDRDMATSYGYPTSLVDDAFASYNSLSFSIDESFRVLPNHKKSTSTEITYPIGDNGYINQWLKALDGHSARCSGSVISTDTNDMILDYDTANSGVGGTNRVQCSYIISNVDISRYGGYSFNNKKNSGYINFSDYSDISSTTVVCKYGDTFPFEFESLRLLYFKDPDVSGGSTQQHIKFSFPSRIDSRYRSDDFHKNYSRVPGNGLYDSTTFLQETKLDGITLFPESYPDTFKDLYRYNNVYSQSGIANIGFPKPFDFTSGSNNASKILASNVKTNGEINDSWTNFLAANFIEVEGGYGELTRLIKFKNKLMFFQKNAFGTLAVNDRSLISDNNIGSISLGTGGVLTRYDYVSQYSGAEFPTDIISSTKSIYYMDSDAKNIYSIDDPDTSISEMNGVNSFLYDNMITGNDRLCGFDVENKEILFTIGDATLCYNENLKNFTSKYSCIPTKYITTPSGLYSQLIDTTKDSSLGYVYRHNSGERGLWYKEVNSGVRSVSKVALIINPNGNIENVFDNIELRTEVYYSGKNAPLYKDLLDETVSRLKFSNSYIWEISSEAAPDGEQTSKLKRLARRWKAQVPLTQNGNRFIDSYLSLTLEFDNNNDKLFKLHDVTSIYRPSNH